MTISLPVTRAVAALRSLTFRSLVLAAMGSALVAQDLQTVSTGLPVQHLGTYSLAKQKFVPAPLGDAGTTETVLFENDSDTYSGLTGLLDDRVYLSYLIDPVDLPEPVAITSLTVGYISGAFGTTSFTLNLHVGAEAGSPGTCYPIRFEDVPGGDADGNTLAYSFDVELSDPASDNGAEGIPIVLIDGRLGVSIQSDASVTGPAWAIGEASDNPFDSSVDAYNEDTTFIVTQFFDQEEGNGASPVLVVRTTPLRFTESERASTLISGETKLVGSLLEETEQRVRFEGLEDERMTVLVRRQKGSSLRPLVDVVDLTSGEIVGQAGKGGGRARTRVTLPSTGLYELVITSADGVPGTFEASVTSKPSKAARKPTKPEAPIAGEPPKVVFPARTGGLLSATFKPTLKDTLINLQPPTLQTDIGEVDISDYITQVGNEFEIDDFPLPAFGGYQLFGGAVVEGEGLEQVPQKIKSRVKIEKIKKKSVKQVGSDDLDIVGHWVRTDFITSENSSRYTFDLDRNSGRSVLVVTDGEAVTTYHIDGWRAFPAVVSSVEGALALELDVSQIETISNSFTSVVDGEITLREYIHPDGDPNRIQFLDSGVIWSRARIELPAVTTLSDPAITADDGEFGIPSGLPSFSVACSPDAQWFEIFRTEGTGDRSTSPRDVVAATCTGGDDSSFRYIDYGATPGVTYRYWVSVLSEDGRKGPTSEPIDVTVPDGDA